jgi:hypothetical protein
MCRAPATAGTVHFDHQARFALERGKTRHHDARPLVAGDLLDAIPDLHGCFSRLICSETACSGDQPRCKRFKMVRLGRPLFFDHCEIVMV